MEENNNSKKQTMLIFCAVCYVFVLFVGLHLLTVRNAGNQDMNIFGLCLLALDHMSAHPFSLNGALTDAGAVFSILGGLTLIFGMVAAYCWTESSSKAHENSTTAKGSASFNKDFKGFKERYTEKKPSESQGSPDPNIILGTNLYYGIKQGRNSNVVIMGSAGSGKSFGVIKPNLMQLNTSYVITDPSGEMFQAEAKLLLENGYNVKIFSTSDMVHSNCYNPFDYVFDEEGKISETRVSTMINMFLQNAADLKNNRGDEFWTKSAKALLTALAMLLLEFFPRQYHNMPEMLRLVQKGRVNENERGASETELDRLFSEARARNPEAHCLSSYDTFKLAPARTANSILISAAVDLNMFNQDEVRNMTTTSYLVKNRNLKGQVREYFYENGDLIRTDDNIDLRTIGDEKTCLFINIPQADSTYNFLVSMMYSQLFETLYGRAEKICPKKYIVLDKTGSPVLTMLDSREDADKAVELYKNAEITERNENGKTVFYLYNRNAEKKFCIPGYGRGLMKRVHSRKAGEELKKRLEGCEVVQGRKRLPVHVQCLLDEFSNIGAIPDFPQKLATMRKYEISCMIVVQSLSQLKNRYDKLYADILSNCDCTIFLGSTDPETCKYISQDRLGKRTIRIENRSRSHSGGKGSRSSSSSYNLDSRDLATPDEVSRLKKDMSYVMVSGEKPFLVKKYKASDHPNWKRTGDVDSKMMMFAENLVVCREKKSSNDSDADAMVRAITGGVSATNENGKPAISNAKKVSNMQAATGGTGSASPVAEKNGFGEGAIAADEGWNGDDLDSPYIDMDSLASNVSRPGKRTT